MSLHCNPIVCFSLVRVLAAERPDVMAPGSNGIRAPAERYVYKGPQHSAPLEP